VSGSPAAPLAAASARGWCAAMQKKARSVEDRAEDSTIGGEWRNFVRGVEGGDDRREQA
jgi:hypothetical protein